MPQQPDVLDLGQLEDAIDLSNLPDAPSQSSSSFLDSVLNNPHTQAFLHGLPAWKGSSPEAETSLLPSAKGIADRRAAAGSSIDPYWEGFASSLYEDIVRPFATPSGIVGSSAPIKAPIAKTGTVLEPEAPVIRGLLEAPKDPIIVGVEGRAQRRSRLTPQEEARLLGNDIDADQRILGKPSEPMGDVIDLAELKEAGRQESLTYTGHEHLGGSTLEIPNREAIPAPMGDTSLGFSEMVPRSEELPYPLNIVPQAVQPRTSQTVMKAVTPVRESPIRSAGPIEFVSGMPKPEVPTPPTRDYLGGTRAISPDEVILPSAVKANAKANTGLKVDTVAIPPETPAPIANGVKEGVKNFVAEQSKPSTLFKSIYSQLSELGAAGRELTQRFQRAAQNRAEYDAVWTEPLFELGKKLKKDEFKNFGAYVEGKMPIPNQRVGDAVEAWKKAQNTMGNEAVAQNLSLKRGDEVIPFQKIAEGYWPRIPAENLTKQDIVDRLVKEGMTRYEAVQVAKHWSNTGEILIRAQHSRTKDLFPYRTDFDVAIHHGRSMAKRIANHRNLGPKDIAGKGSEGIANLIEDTSNPNLAMQLAKRLAGRDELPNERLVNGLNQARKWMSLTSLPNFTIPNVILGQATNAHMAMLSRHPIEATKEIFKLLRGSYRDEVRLAGVFNSFNRTLVEELSGIDPFQIGIGEKINRSVAAAVGRSAVREAFTDFKAGQNVDSARYFLETLLSRPAESVTGITPELERFAAGRMAEITQGLNNPGNLPYGWSNPVNSYGRVAEQLMLIFKKVGFQSTKTIKDSIKMNPALAIPSWLAITQVAGEMAGDVKSLLTGKDRPEELMNRIADNWGNAFMLGLPWELATSAQYGPTALIGAAAGPAFSKASEFGYDVYKTMENLYEGKEDPFSTIRKFGTRNLPFPGRERLREK